MLTSDKIIFMKIFYLIVLFIIACKNNSTDLSERKDGYTPVLKTKVDSLFHEVMQGHDAGMAKMNRLRKYLTQVKQQLDSISKLRPAKINQSYRQSLQKLKEKLEYSENAMFTWMEEFKADSAKDNEEQRLLYLEAEKRKVTKVRDHILNSLQQADSLLSMGH